ncbi:NAD(P)-dependent dehydrogenase (short-subunit alcohol dehydrogenase family) [Rhodococcus sp. 27YEA15]|uniref:SDR family NAD(P)-dependent oxidoreductase n=1 Tax=Rhodococcus sp. 27YEA15 TaxID=3156259 RepID=UPI003C7E494C
MNAFTDRVAIVTGAGGTMGRAIAARLARDGAHVVGFDLPNAPIQRIETVSGPGSIRVVSGDVSCADDVTNLVASVLDEYGRIDVVVNNAAAQDEVRSGRETQIADLDPEVFERIMRVNLHGPFLLARSVLPAMVERRRGTFVNISAWSATRAVPRMSAYSISKAGLEALGRQISRDYGTYGIRANNLVLGFIRVDTNEAMQDSPLGAQIRDSVQMLPTVGRPEDVGEAVAFLAGDGSRFISGASLPIEGGSMAKGVIPPELFAQYIDHLPTYAQSATPIG